MQWFCYFQKISSKMKWLQSWWANLAYSNLQAKRSLLCMKRGASDPPTQSSCRSFRKYVLDLATLEFTQTNYNQFTPQSKRKEYMVLKGGYKYGRDIKELPLTDVPQLLICVKNLREYQHFKHGGEELLSKLRFAWQQLGSQSLTHHAMHSPPWKDWQSSKYPPGT